jgi:molybdopterin converting factor small subunit
MHFVFFGPLRRVAGMDAMALPLARPRPLRDLMGPLHDRLGALLPYGEASTDVQILANLSFFRDNRAIGLDARIEPGDTVQVVLPATGG